ncbi:hypothetical protein [Vampirovibrio chlorellavorus]|uniref:hypothetical protein n=1 Tax=Vampirovibrio chlorellavorus TaxID=758823 RepID=UPI0026F21E0D|nr:hypothetical protein [Vampirovibrio chlorellavorus]
MLESTEEQQIKESILEIIDWLINQESGVAEWLDKTYPECRKEQKNLEEGSIERGYWHFGYLVAVERITKTLRTRLP